MLKEPKTIILFEDDAALTTEPLSLTRPVWDLRCGIRTLGRMILDYFPKSEIFQYARPHLLKILSHPLKDNNRRDNDDLWINGSLVPGTGFISVSELKIGYAWVKENRVIAFRGDKPELWEAGTQLSADRFNNIEAPSDVGHLIRYPWEIVNSMQEELTREAQELRALGECRGQLHKSVVLNESKDIFIAEGCSLAPGTVIDATQGPVVLDVDVLVGANTVIEGPSYLGPGTQVKPLSHILASNIGEQCRIGGEISVSIIQGYSNKAHGGFLGHSFIGEWCNLGSGTETSNLKNNYSPVKVQVGSDLIDTGELFIGLTMGDHSKSAIGTVFNTGTMVGVGCNIFGAGFPPRHIPSFHWGGAEKLVRYPFKRTLDTASEMMRRRQKDLSREQTEILTWIYENRGK